MIAFFIRFRPIMMTTLAALLGSVPIALGYRIGRRVAASARPRGRRRPDRLQLITLYLTPVVYTVHGDVVQDAQIPVTNASAGESLKFEV